MAHHDEGDIVLERDVEHVGAGSYAAHVIIAEPNDNIQLYQMNIDLEPKRDYVLCFMAYSSGEQNLSLHIHKHESDYDNYGLNNKEVDLNNEWQYFEVPFTTKNFGGIVSDARLRFWFAPYVTDSGVEYWIDNVVLVEVSP